MSHFDYQEYRQNPSLFSECFNKLLDNRTISRILITINGTNTRLDRSTINMLQTLQEMFPPKLLENNIGIVFTKVKMNKKDIARREESSGGTNEDLANEYITDVKKKLTMEQNVFLPHFFIDSNYDNEDVDEKEKFNNAVEALWQFIGHS